LDNFRDSAGSHRSPAFPDRESQPLLHRDRRDQLDRQLRVVSRHHHLHSFIQRRHSRHIRRPEVELRSIPAEKRRVPSSLFLRQHIYLCFELRVRRDRTRLCYHLPSLDLFSLNPSQQQPHVVSRHSRVQQLLEHLNAGHYRLSRVLNSDDLDFFSDLDLSSLDSACRHRSSSRNREDVFNRHQERLVDFTRRLRDVAVYCFHQLIHSLLAVSLSVQRLQRAPSYDRNLITGESVARQQFSHLEFHQIQQLRIVHRVYLIHEHDHRRHSYLSRQQDVLSSLRHRSVRRCHYQYRSVHLRRPGDHVLDVVRMSRAVHVRIVPVLRLVLHVRCCDRDSSRLLFRRIVNRIK